ncbi:MAG: VWA domain-containing protein, partial [Gammaproteobacteria bacterium]
DRVSFGLVAYRDNPEVAPGLEYRTRSFITLAEGMDGEAFLAKTQDVVPASVSSKDFREDAYAGLKEAIDGMDWSGFEGRYVVLITDAGPREGDDPLGSTGLDTAAINQLAQDKKIAVWVMHLKTPYTVADHDYAESRYRAVSKYPGIGDFYYDVGHGDVGEFGGVLTALTAQITRQVGDAAAGVAARKIEESNEAEPDQLSRFQRKVELLGYALRMRYLQRQDNSTVPSVFDAWLVDRDFRDPERASLDVRVLLTREQLSDLQSVLRRVLETAEEGVLAPDTFLSELKSLAAAVSRDPEAVSTSTRAAGAKGNLADLGYMREYIEDLPYTGEIMNLSLEDWEDWPARRQLQFIHRLENRISYYQALHDDTDLWVSLDGGPIDGDSVFPVVLEMLP